MSFKKCHRDINISIIVLVDLGYSRLSSFLILKRNIRFYMDQQHFTLRMKEGFSVLKMQEPFKENWQGSFWTWWFFPFIEKSAYSIVSGAAIKRLLFSKFFVPTLFVIFGLVIRLWVMSKPINSAQELTMEVLDCSAICCPCLWTNPRQLTHHVYAWFG